MDSIGQKEYQKNIWPVLQKIYKQYYAESIQAVLERIYKQYLTETELDIMYGQYQTEYMNSIRQKMLKVLDGLCTHVGRIIEKVLNIMCRRIRHSIQTVLGGQFRVLDSSEQNIYIVLCRIYRRF